jgi:hypothetical protein
MEHEHEKEHKEHRHSDFLPKHIQTQQTKMDKKMIVMMVLVGLLVLVSAVQAVELVQLKGKLADESLTLGKATQKTSIGSAGSGSGSTLSKNLENLPSMVGGC